MANLNFDQGFPYATYREYISALAATDSVFTTLDEFFFSKPSYLTKNSTATTSQKQGAVTIFDCVDGQIRERDFFPSDFHAFSLALDQRPQNSQTRIIVIGYSRDLFNSRYYEVNKDTLELLGRKYRLHPEIFLWHFTSTSNSRPVRTAFYDTENATFASPLSNRPFFHIQDHSSLVSCCSFNSGREANTGMQKTSVSC